MKCPKCGQEMKLNPRFEDSPTREDGVKIALAPSINLEQKCPKCGYINAKNYVINNEPTENNRNNNNNNNTSINKTNIERKQ